MAKATVTSLTEKERGLIAETQLARLRGLDEDELVELHTRVRRARNKFVKLHRRDTAAQVIEASARGIVNAGPRRSASKAEIFEDALARVSTSLAKAARESATALRDERLAAAGGTAVRQGETAKPVPTTARPPRRRGAHRFSRSSASRRRPPARRVLAGKPNATLASVGTSTAASVAVHSSQAQRHGLGAISPRTAGPCRS